MRNISYILLVVALVSLAACEGNVREKMGLKKEAPDEFMVLHRPSLTVPPEFNLPNPTEKASRFDRNRQRDNARNVLIATQKIDGQAVEEQTSGESLLLQNIGAQHNDPEIRKKLNEDYQELVEDREEIKGRMFGLRGLIDPILPDDAKEEYQDDIIDPEEEEERLAKERLKKLEAK